MDAPATLADAVFPPATPERWRELALAALKGADFERRLVSRTDDGLRIAPLYPPAEAAPRPIRAPAAWRIAQRVEHPAPEEAARLALADLEGGADALTLVFAGAPGARGFGLPLDLDTLDQALAGVDLGLIGLRLEAGGRGRDAAALLAALARRRGHALAALDLDLGLDPIGAFAASGRLSAPFETVAARAGETLHALDADGFRGRLLLADGRPFHEGGASEAQELAAVLAVGVASLRGLEAAGHDLSRARDAIALMLTADADAFLTIAKLRAARGLWARIEAACGLDPRPVRLHAETAWRMATRRDPWVNLLRGTMAAFAAGIGGADAVTVLPFTAALGLPDGFARRLARNTQAILLEEANLWRVADPAAGTGGLEALTDDLSARAWTLFQEIEAEGGIVASLSRGALQARIAETAAARARAVAHRRHPITGTSEFPDLHERPVAVLRPMPESVPEPLGAPAPSARPVVVPFADLVARAGSGVPFPAAPAPAVSAEPLTARRLAEPFERLRDRAEAGGTMSVFLANLGPLAEFNARATFARNAFEAGGLGAPANDGFADLDAMATAFAAAGTPLACLCASDARYASEGEEAARRLKRAGARLVLLAGAPGEAEAALRAAGVDRFLQHGGDLVALLAEAQAAGTLDNAAPPSS